MADKPLLLGEKLGGSNYLGGLLIILNIEISFIDIKAYLYYLY